MLLTVPKNRFGTPLRWHHRVVWRCLRTLRLSYPLTVGYSERLPLDGPALVIAPHMSYSDSLPFLYTSLPRTTRIIGSSFFVLANAPVLWLMFLGGAMPLDKHVPDTQAARWILRLLAAGDVVALFPEGGRSWAGVPIGPILPCAKFLARLKVPIIIAEFRGSYDHWPRWKRTPRWRPVTVRLRNPVKIPRHIETRADSNGRFFASARASSTTSAASSSSANFSKSRHR